MPKAAPQPEPEQLPPHSPEAEQAVLGCCLLDPENALAAAVVEIGETHDVFYDTRHQKIFAFMAQLFDASMPVDLVTLADWLRCAGDLDTVGGIAYLASLMDTVASGSSIAHYIEILRSHYKQRRLLQICAETSVRVFEHENSTELVQSAAQQLIELSETHTEQEEEPMTDLVHRALERMEHAYQHQGVITGIESGFIDLDRLTTGFHPGEMIVIAARPGIGKTSCSMNIVEHVAVANHIPVGVFSLEMTRDSLVLRMLCSRSRTSFRRISEGMIAATAFPRIAAAAANMNQAPIYINDLSGLSILGLRTRARRMFRMHAIRLLVIDYLQLLCCPGCSNRQEEVTQISAGIKNLAKELNIPVIVLSQLNRSIENDKTRKPRLSDLRESGSIEQDADVVMFLYRPPTGEDNGDSEAIPTNLIIAKQRNGPIGEVPLMFLKHITRFESCASVSHSDNQSGQADQEQQQEFSNHGD
jgi:replicative DNA helicase